MKNRLLTTMTILVIATSTNTALSQPTILHQTQIIGRIHLDSNWHDEKQSTLKKSNGTTFARARLGVKGHITNTISYKIENDFAENLSELKDATIAYTGFKDSTIILGQSKPNFSLEMLESSNNMSFIQRAAVSDDAVLLRQVGINANKRGHKWRIAAGLFGQSIGDESRNDDNKYSFTARATTTPINNDRSLLHLGIATSYTSRNQNTTNNSDVLDKEHLIGAELIARYQKITLQSEYILNHSTYTKNTNYNNKATFPGYYAQLSYFLTGEQRYYKIQDAKLGKIKVKKGLHNGGFGALELAARFSHLDRNDTVIQEGETNNYTFGINWYANNNLRFMLNYLTSQTDYNTPTKNKSHNTLSLRTAFYF